MINITEFSGDYYVDKSVYRNDYIKFTYPKGELVLRMSIWEKMSQKKRNKLLNSMSKK